MTVLKPAHANSCEVLGTLLAVSYGFDGGWGLNPSLAGGIKMQGKGGLLDHSLSELWVAGRKQFLEKSDLFDRHLRKDTAKLLAADEELNEIETGTWEKKLQELRGRTGKLLLKLKEEEEGLKQDEEKLARYRDVIGTVNDALGQLKLSKE
ncbi:uncharacterized protein HMPREF1541_05626 [Cyphellophora europaea CBS 101466]|uniref:Uncharacterized protein n=1 Tax=Cyphellophora europaea (strain CBS 101466) TaxID=1220924 RepID=W2RUH4_CYPE1|nr:uncharacterized protein HMPREF1541_05626 [Cyphellophora europaea CBS 101466]ETN39403.1 hypothetical protein HMPREF1541_05626 [Cyphellophora europaea CBS 101466]